MEPSYSGLTKRAKALGNATQVANCLVDGCNADLSLCRDYHRRHKVCEIHSKTPKVTIGGREQRFCQQCSRFHSLVEFDEGKRSCRKRLDGHNRRRRKPQPVPLARNSGLTFSSQQNVASTTRSLSFTSQQVLPSAIVGPTWSGFMKAENEPLLYNNDQLNYVERRNTFPECSPPGFNSKGGGLNQLPFIQEAIHLRPLLDPNVALGSSSNRALSLLSSPPTVAPEFSLSSSTNHGVQTQTRLHNLPYSGLGQYEFLQERDKPVESHTRSATAAPTLHFPDGSPSSSTIGSHQTLTFTWE